MKSSDVSQCLEKIGQLWKDNFLVSFSGLINDWELAGFEKPQLDDSLDNHTAAFEEFLKERLIFEKRRANAVLDAKSDVVFLGKLLGENIPNLSPGELSVTAYQSSLTKRLENLQAEKEERLAKLKSLRDREQFAASQMGLDVSERDTSSVPSLEYLETYQTFVEGLERDLNERKTKFEDCRMRTLELVDALGERDSRRELLSVVLDGPSNQFVYSDDTLQQFYTYREQLKDMFESRLKIKSKLEESIRYWAKRLGVEEEYAIPIDQNCAKASTIDLFREMNEKLRQLKMSQLPTLLRKAREEIGEMWSSLMCAECEKQDFADQLRCKDYTEDLLEAHDAELRRLHTEREGKQEILDLLHSRAELVVAMKDIYDRENDPNRFRNRKAQMLVDDQEKARICKALPTHEAQILDRIKDWENRTSKSFLIGGKTFEQVLAEDVPKRARDLKHRRNCACCGGQKENDAKIAEVPKNNSLRGAVKESDKVVRGLNKPFSSSAMKRKAENTSAVHSKIMKTHH
ncbi:unnamed protein product [Notodromas monacha]|uniref:Protein regulator of cytokinesis 1 n=1 Tax=Notodromas monacha TaxID=399045 RepID=A0A7R9BLP5_9CRUS|nr:unnamed protein product [Notodromas monacha]CAG0916931.1 unnamed protein product [Notodromas monacha]